MAPVAEVPLELVVLLCKLTSRRSGFGAFAVAPQRPLAHGSARRRHLDDGFFGLRLADGTGITRWQPHTQLLLGGARRHVAVCVRQRLELGAVVAAAHAQNCAVAPRLRRAAGHWTQLPRTTPPP